MVHSTKITALYEWLSRDDKLQDPREILRKAPCCKKIGLDRVLITCEPDNPGSRRTILANGGVYEGTFHEPNENYYSEHYWIAI